ncbi:Uncharacterized methyltransferase At2g41040, chloroplastic [Linum perenne]
MAVVPASVASSSSLNRVLQYLPENYPRLPSPYILSHPSFRPRLRLPFTAIATIRSVAVKQDSRAQLSEDVDTEIFACPVCYEPLIRKGPSGFNLAAIYRSGFRCRRCNNAYSSRGNYLDLTVTAGMKTYFESMPLGTELFRSPLVSFLYERGWRQNFNWSGFPGPDEEFKMAQEYFKSAEGGMLVDVSCGSGLFSRKFAKSGTYSKVVALDFSENMLRQCYDFIKEDDTISDANLALVRADVSRLPFSLGSVDAVHAGAALHCWPAPSNAISEICRVLKSGGILVGATFLRYTSSTPEIVRPLTQRFLARYNFFTEGEIEDLCTSCGLTNYTKKVEGLFIMFSAQKA